MAVDMTTILGRKAPIHLPVHQRDNNAVMVLLAVCTDQRRQLLARNEVHDIIVSAWKAADGWAVGRYVIMPDHMHLFCTPSQHDYPALGKWVQYWKATTTREWPWPGEKPLWQKSYWDRQMRCGEKYGEKWQYVRNNPVRAGLCDDADRWPFQGEIKELMWSG